jgi:hypothetical protein
MSARVPRSLDLVLHESRQLADRMDPAKALDVDTGILSTLDLQHHEDEVERRGVEVDHEVIPRVNGRGGTPKALGENVNDGVLGSHGVMSLERSHARPEVVSQGAA